MFLHSITNIESAQRDDSWLMSKFMWPKISQNIKIRAVRLNHKSQVEWEQEAAKETAICGGSKQEAELFMVVICGDEPPKYSVSIFKSRHRGNKVSKSITWPQNLQVRLLLCHSDVSKRRYKPSTQPLFWHLNKRLPLKTVRNTESEGKAPRADICPPR